MDVKGFQAWLSAASGLARAQRREALAVLSGRSEGEASKAAIELGVDEARALSALRARVGGFARYGAGSAALPVQGLRQDLQRAERYAAVGLAPQGTLAVVRGVAGEGRDGEGLGGALRCGGEHGIPLGVTGFWRRRGAIRRYSRGSWKRTRPTSWRAGRVRAGLDARHGGGAAKAKKRGLSREQVPVLMAADRSGTTVSAVLPRVDAAALTAALDPVVAKDALLVSDGGASYPPCAAALGVSHEALNRSMGGTGSGRSACADGEQPATAG